MHIGIRRLRRQMWMAQHKVTKQENKHHPTSNTKTWGPIRKRENGSGNEYFILLKISLTKLSKYIACVSNFLYSLRIISVWVEIMKKLRLVTEEEVMVAQGYGGRDWGKSED